MEIKECADQRQRLLSSAANRETQENYEEDEDEAISLRNLPLPLIHHQNDEQNTNEEHSDTSATTLLDDFNFCSPEAESEMRAADEIFFRGQILPQNKFQQHNSISRSQSMDHYFSADFCPSSSHHSAAAVPRNQFHSHPSPSPRIVRNRQQIIRNNNRNCVQKSLSWNVFRGGLIAAPPEINIAFGDLKSRCSGKNRMRSEKKKEKKRGKAWDIVGGFKCKCSVDDAIIDATISPQIAIVKRSVSGEDDNSAVKKSVNHRTSEWLKQLSLQRTAAAER